MYLQFFHKAENWRRIHNFLWKKEKYVMGICENSKEIFFVIIVITDPYRTQERRFRLDIKMNTGEKLKGAGEFQFTVNHLQEA